MQFTIKTHILKALLLVTPKKDPRDYITAVHFESTDAGVLAVATDGHRLLAAKLNSEPVEGLKHLVSRELCEQASRTKSAYINITIEGNTVTLNNIMGRIQDGAFPDFRRVIPAMVSGERLSEFNNKYLVDFDKIANLVGEKKASILQNGEYAALVKFVSPDLVGVLMPMRHELPTSITRPNWI